MRFLKIAVVIFAVVMGSGCAAFVNPSNTGGRSGLQQMHLSTLVDRAVDELNFGPDLARQRVYLEVGDLDAEGVVGDYVRSSVIFSLARQGALVTNDLSNADIHLVVKVRTAGADNMVEAPALLSLLKSMIVLHRTTVVRAELHAQGIDIASGRQLFSPEKRSSLHTHTKTDIAIPLLYGWF